MSPVLMAFLAAIRVSVQARAELEAEILALRHQLAVLQRAAPKRPHLSRADRLLWVLLSRVWTGWRRSVQIVQPATVVRWHRRAFALHWRWRSRRARVGRPAVARDIRALIRQMRSANPLWGAPRIHGELRKLGIEVSQTTVAKYIQRRRTPPSPTWRTFLTTHVSQLASIDFFTVPTATFRVLFVLIVLCARPPACRLCQRHVPSHRRLDAATNPRSLSLGPDAAVSAARSGRDLWLRLWSQVARFRD